MRATTLSILVCLITACQAGSIVDPNGQPNEVDGPGHKLGSDVLEVLDDLPSAQVTAVGSRGVPSFIRGNLGQVDPAGLLTNADPLGDQLAPIAALFRVDPENLELVSVREDALGLVHVHYAQNKEAHPVAGGEIRVHVTAGGTIYAVNGTARNGVDLPPVATVGMHAARDLVASDPSLLAAQVSKTTLSYVLTPREGEMHFAWRVEVSGVREGDPVRDIVFVDATTAEIIVRLPQIHSARDRRVHDAQNGVALPGTLVMAEGDPATADTVAVDAYDHAGWAYDCMASLFGRDSFDGAGAAIQPVVHFDDNYANAFWDGTYAVFGDGDGAWFGNLGQSADIMTHEIFHGVTQHTAGLVYTAEPGALNEAMSDIAAAACDVWRRGTADGDTWRLGEDVFTPGTPGDALRYLDDPAADGVSRDFYPERYTGAEDNGGVHINSGIGNLAFRLLATGGTHPRSKTTVEVPPLGVDVAAAIFYRALSEYLTGWSNFEIARAATAQAALDLYDDVAAEAVHLAWNAVGVPGAPADGGSQPSTPLANGGTVEALAGDAGDQRYFTFDVPSDASTLTVTLSGGTGDADLYVRFGERPNLVVYDYRPYQWGNEEVVAVDAPAAGVWHVMLHGYAAYAGLTLQAVHDGTITVEPAEVCDSGADDDGDGLADCADADCSESPVCQQVVNAGDLVITEIMSDPRSGTGDPANEWFEIYNRTGRTVDLAGFSFTDEDGSPFRTHTIDSPVEIPAFGYATLAYTADASLGFTPDYVYGATRIILANAGDQISLYSREGILIDRVDYDAAGFPNVHTGVSLELELPDAVTNDDGAQWCRTGAGVYNADERGTPGGPGACSGDPTDLAPGDLVITEILYDSSATEPAGEWFELANQSGRALSVGGLEIRSGASSTVVAGAPFVAPGARVVLCRSVDLGPAGCVPYDRVRLFNGADSLTVTSAAGVDIDRVDYDSTGAWPTAQAGVSIELDDDSVDPSANDVGYNWCAATAPSGADLATPGAAASCDTAPRAPVAGDLVVTEIMFNPSAAEPWGEWLELANVSGDNLDLSGSALVVGSNRDTLAGLTALRGTRAVLCRSAVEGPTGCSEYGGSIRLANAGDTITLLGPGDVTVDTVAYQSGAPWPASVNGVAIELSESNVDAASNDDASNWCLAANQYAADYGTPGAAGDCQ